MDAKIKKRKTKGTCGLKAESISVSNCRPASETPFKWRFANGPKVASFYMFKYWDMTLRSQCMTTFF